MRPADRRRDHRWFIMPADGIRTNILARVLRDHHRLREGHPDQGCGDVGCAYTIAREYRILARRYPKRDRGTANAR